MVEHLVGHPGRSLFGRFGLVAALVVFLVACSDDDEASQSTTTTSRPASASTTTAASDDPTEDEVVAAYEASGEAFIEAAAVPDPDHPRIAATHTGPMLERTRATLLALQADGRVIRYPPNSQYRVEVETVEVEDDVARLTFCAVDDGERVVASTGEVIASGVATVEGRAAMRLEDGVWKLAEQEFESRESGVASC